VAMTFVPGWAASCKASPFVNLNQTLTGNYCHFCRFNNGFAIDETTPAWMKCQCYPNHDSIDTGGVPWFVAKQL